MDSQLTEQNQTNINFVDFYLSKQENVLRPIHIHFTKTPPPEEKLEKFRSADASLQRKVVFCHTWSQLTALFKLCPASISINECQLKDTSLIETISMIETLSNFVSCCSSRITISIGVNRSTPYSLIKDAQKTRVVGIVPSCDEFDCEETLKGINAQWNGIPYWPKHIINQLPGAVKLKTPPAQSAIVLTPRQQQIFNIVTERGCSNKHVAKIIGISESTVKLHMGHIFKKYGVKNRTQLAVFAKPSDS
jgi:DNA-binding NarL/FixJ family response regulator